MWSNDKEEIKTYNRKIHKELSHAIEHIRCGQIELASNLLTQALKEDKKNRRRKDRKDAERRMRRIIEENLERLGRKVANNASLFAEIPNTVNDIMEDLKKR